MLRLIIGNKAYSSWSMRGWLACRQSGLDFEELVVPLYDADWPVRRAAPDLAPSAGKVPILWDGDEAVWDSLAIVETLAERGQRERFWPADPGARAAARSIAAEMHAGFAALRRDFTMNTRRRFPAGDIGAEAAADIARIVAVWTQARARWGGGGDFLFGAFGAADIMFAPVVTRFVTYSLPTPPAAADYCAAILAHPFVAEWLAAAEAEPWTIDRFEPPAHP